MIRKEGAGPISDIEAGKRYEYIVDAGRRIFAGSALVDPLKVIGRDDLELIRRFHGEISPMNPQSPWRLKGRGAQRREGAIVDPSTYENWELPGGPLEHIGLATRAAEIIVREIQQNLKTEKEVGDDSLRKIIRELEHINPLHTAAATAFHDEGREITHIFFTNEKIGAAMLRKMGVRADIREIIPDETILLLPPEEDMTLAVRHLKPETVMIWIADNLGKRKPGSNRLLISEDFDATTQEEWASGYINKPFSGRATDRFFRENVSLHNKNGVRFWKAIKLYISDATHLTIKDLESELTDRLGPTLLALTDKCAI